MKHYDPRRCEICGREYVPKRINQRTCLADECREAHRKKIWLAYSKKYQSSLREQKREYMRDQRHPERKAKEDTIVAIGYAERQMANSLAKAGKVRTEL